MRFGLYFIPEPMHPLYRAGAGWLGRDIYTGQICEPSEPVALPSATRHKRTGKPRKYGFHGTLKAPFRLADECRPEALVSAFHEFCRSTTAFDMPKLKVAMLGSFFALKPAEPSFMLNDLAEDIVSYFEPFRAPLSEAEIVKRSPEQLSESELSNLRDWGYPYVFEDFRFHMTLSEAVPEDERSDMQAVLEDYFNPVLQLPLAITSLALVSEQTPQSPFMVHSIGRFLPQKRSGAA